MSAVNLALALLALFGHAAIWVGFVNRVHALGLPHWVVELLSRCGHFLQVALPISVAWLWWCSAQPLDDWLATAATAKALWIYLIPCWFVAFATAAAWLSRQVFSQHSLALSANHTTLVDVAAQLGRKPLSGLPAKLLSYVPSNQVLQVAVQEKQLVIDRLSAELDGLSITHLTDLHITGRVGVEFFNEVIRQANALRSDLVVITGDIIDNLEFLDSTAELLSRLSAPLGVYFILGNHDQYTHNAPRVRRALTRAGLTDLGGRWQRVETAGIDVILAGNELPWFGPALDMATCPPRETHPDQLRFLLSHSPDQFPWARRHDFDLVLAGHLHGGQICLPVIGPIFSPSWHGVKYASGVFRAPPTLMHVSRGISSELPVRLNCRPELAKLVLRCPQPRV